MPPSPRPRSGSRASRCCDACGLLCVTLLTQTIKWLQNKSSCRIQIDRDATPVIVTVSGAPEVLPAGEAVRHVASPSLPSLPLGLRHCGLYRSCAAPDRLAGRTPGRVGLASGGVAAGQRCAHDEVHAAATVTRSL